MNETLKRAISGAVYIILLLGCILHSRESLALLFGVFLGIAVYEFCKILHLNFWVCLVISIIAYYFLWSKYELPPSNQVSLMNLNYWLNSRIIICIFSVASAIKLIFYLFNQSKTNFSIISNYLLWIGYILSTFIAINYLPIGKGNVYNPKILISIFILIWTNDTFAYLVGKNFGKRKLFPAISPKKTIEGFVGGLFFSIISGMILSYFYIGLKDFYFWIIIAIIVSIFSTLGDLIESKFKRVAGIKDSGKIMPGHGGILDRLDSIIFVIPFINLFYLILHYLQYVS